MKTMLLIVMLMCSLINNYSQESPFHNYILITDTINDLNKKLNGIKPVIGFGFSGNSSESNDLYRLNSNISLDYGCYPSELNIMLKTETLLINGITDKISDLFISYDNHHKIGDKRFLESFVFVSRYSDVYLGIDEKYELGVGTLFNYWTLKNLTKEGKTNELIINRLSNYNPDDITLKKLWIKDTYSDKVENLKHANIKKYSKLRLALLVGLFYEIEKVFFEDSISTNNGKIHYSYKFDGTVQLNWEIRPTLELYFGDNINLKLKPYLKMPLPGKYLSIVEYNNTKDSRVDYFIDFPVSIGYKANGNMELSINYRFMYDNAPQRKYLIVDNSSIPVLIMPNQKHQSISLMFKFSL
jgi:hypothetical protein